MQYIGKIKVLSVIFMHTFFGYAILWANNESGASSKVGLNTIQEVFSSLSKEAVNVSFPSEKKESEAEKMTLPLVRVAHKNVLDLLYLSFLSKPMHLSSYIPFLQHIGVRLNWFKLLSGWYIKEQQTYEGGVDFHFRSNIQLSVDIGYASCKLKQFLQSNSLKYQSQGKYLLGAVQYLMYPNPLTNAYLGIGYGQSQFSLITSDLIATKPFTAHWLKFIFGSELRLFSNSGLYGGMQFGIGHLLYCKKNADASIVNYFIPGFGKIINKIIFDVALYLKFNISFLEKQIFL